MLPGWGLLFVGAYSVCWYFPVDSST